MTIDLHLAATAAMGGITFYLGIRNYGLRDQLALSDAVRDLCNSRIEQLVNECHNLSVAHDALAETLAQQQRQRIEASAKAAVANRARAEARRAAAREKTLAAELETLPPRDAVVADVRARRAKIKAARDGQDLADAVISAMKSSAGVAAKQGE